MFQGGDHSKKVTLLFLEAHIDTQMICLIDFNSMHIYILYIYMLYKICVGKTIWWICGMHLIRSNTAQVGHLPNFIPIRSTELHSLTSPWLVELSSRCTSLKFYKSFPQNQLEIQECLTHFLLHIT